MVKPIPLSLNQIKKIRKLQQKKYRIQFSLMLCEGLRSFKSAILAGCKISEIVVSDEFMLNPNFDLVLQAADNGNIPLLHCTAKEMHGISDEATPPGLLFLVHYMAKTSENLDQISSSSLIYLENISDPGNLGVIMRSSVWFGMTDILLSPGCVDPGNPKSIRASAGAIFTAHIYVNIPPEQLISYFKPRGFRFYATALDNGLAVSKWLPGDKNITLFGSEANGLSDFVIKQCDEIITIPGSDQTESLNLAVSAGIILYQLSIRH